MTDISGIRAELDEQFTRFFTPLQTTRAVDRIALEAFYDTAQRLPALLKGTDVVSKPLLRTLYVAMSILRAEAPYTKNDSCFLEEMADKIQMIFDLIIYDDSLEGWKPGIPRVQYPQ